MATKSRRIERLAVVATLAGLSLAPASLVAAPGTPERVRERLADVAAARAFAVDALGLPDNGSYRSYVALDRDYVVVNVFAAAEFSLAPKHWCYPFVGCTAYRGYFSETDAKRYAARLSRAGFDTATSRVRAYSTLGRFRDPVLSTMIAGSSDAAVSLMFHELAHQVVYVRDDTAFNESFASFVAAEGLRRWRERQGRTVDARALDARREALRVALEELREALQVVYDGPGDDDARRAAKARLFEAFADEWRRLGGRPPAPDNNAALVPIALYADRTAAFAALLEASGGDLPRFYDRVRKLAALGKDARNARLDALAAG